MARGWKTGRGRSPSEFTPSLSSNYTVTLVFKFSYYCVTQVKPQSLCNGRRAHILSASPHAHATQPRLSAALVWVVFFAPPLCAAWTIPPLDSAHQAPQPLWVITSVSATVSVTFLGTLSESQAARLKAGGTVLQQSVCLARKRP